MRPITQLGWATASSTVAAAHFFQRPFPERTAGGGDGDLVDLAGIPGTQHLKDRIMFGIDRDDLSPRALQSLAKHRARRDHAFLVGQGHDHAALDRGQGRLDGGGAHDRHHDEIRGKLRRRDHRVASGRRFDAGAGQSGPQFQIERGIADHRPPRPKCPRLFDQKLGICLGGQRHERKRVLAIDVPGMGDDIQGVDADGTGRAQDRDAAMERVLERRRVVECAGGGDGFHDATPNKGLRPVRKISNARMTLAAKVESIRSNTPP